jgi:HlyD family secretion protein
MKSELEKIELRSEELDSILGKTPNSLIRWGISFIFGFIALLLIGSLFFKYPDAIQAPVEITTFNPPASLVARADGKITHLFVSDRQSVKKNTVLATIENPADFNQVQQLRTKLNNIQEIIARKNNLNFDKLNFDSFNKLGEVQPAFTAFTKALGDVKRYSQIDFYRKKTAAVEKQINMTKLYHDRLYSQRNLMEKDLKLGKQQYNRDSTLFKNKVIAQSDLENTASLQLQKNYSFEGAQLNLADMQIKLTVLEEQLLDLNLQAEEQEKQLFLTLGESHKSLLNQISVWEQLYVLKSPIDGKVTYTKYWSENQNVKLGETVLTVIPENKSVIIGKLNLQMQGAGKVKIGQKVNIRFDNYPYMEYGMVQASIRNISMTSENNGYPVELQFPNGLKTNYKINLQYTNGMKGSAEIITEDLTLFERFFNPVKSLFKKHF